MLGNNLSQLGVDAGKLDSGLNALFRRSLVDADHGRVRARRRALATSSITTELATLVGANFTRSREDAQSQPGVDDF